MNVRLPEHSHCLHCGDPVPADATYCSDECRQERETTKRRADRRMWLFYIVAIIAVVGIWIYSYVL